MKDYIEREAAMSAIQNYLRKIPNTFYLETEAWINRVIQSVPAANVAPVRHGKWIWEEVPTSELGKIVCFKCTVCLKRQTFRSHFCPNCGADMRGE